MHIFVNSFQSTLQTLKKDDKKNEQIFYGFFFVNE